MQYSLRLCRSRNTDVLVFLTTRRDQLRDCEYIAKHRLRTAPGLGSQDSTVDGVVNTDNVDSLGYSANHAAGTRDSAVDVQSMASSNCAADDVVVERAHIDDVDAIMELVGEAGTSRRNYLMGMLQCQDWPTWCIRNEDGRVVAFCLMHRDGMWLCYYFYSCSWGAQPCDYLK